MTKEEKIKGVADGMLTADEARKLALGGNSELKETLNHIAKLAGDGKVETDWIEIDYHTQKMLEHLGYTVLNMDFSKEAKISW